MKYRNIRSCKWANASHSFIDCEVDFEDLAEEYVPYTAEQGSEIFDKAVNGDFGNITEYEEPAVDAIEIRRAEILSRISQIESEKLRPLSDLLTPELFTEADLEYSQSKLSALQTELIGLRAELRTLL